MSPLEIKTGRKKLGLNQSGLAELLSVSLSSVKSWETGQRNMSSSAELLFKKYLQEKGTQSEPNNIISEPEGDYSIVKKNGIKFNELDNGKYVMYVPHVTEPAQAGYLSSYSDAQYVEELPYKAVIVDNLHQGNYRAFDVAGDSMDDGTRRAIEHGDVVVGRRIDKQYWTTRFHIHRYKEFVIVHEDGILIKEIIKHDYENGFITCHSYNDAPEYDDFEISLKEVYEIYNVVEVSKQRR